MRKYIALTMLILISGLAAQGTGFSRGMGWNDDLNLTSEQIKQIEEYRVEFRKQQIDLRADLQKLRLELQVLLKADNPDQKAIDKQLEKIQVKELAMEKLRVAHHLQVRELLTDEQKVLFDQHSFGRGMYGDGERGRGYGRDLDDDATRGSGRGRNGRN